MFKFNNDHIFTGYLKQVLASFPLPKCHVYTREQQQHQKDYLKNFKQWETEKIKLNEAKEKLLAEQSLLEADITQIKKLLESTEDADYAQLLSNCFQESSQELLKVQKQLKEAEQKLLQLGPELNVLQTNYHSTYPTYPGALTAISTKLTYPSTMRYIPYIKDGYLQEYVDGTWQHFHHSFNDENHIKVHKPSTTILARTKYSYGKQIPNYTKTLKIQNTVYDSYTHEYLGDYLRFHRDFANINLMPLYNCFSNRACPNLDLKVDVGNGYTALFKTEQAFNNTLYKYYMVPVKFFKNYTIAIDSGASIEVCCCVYNEYQNTDKDLKDIPKLTYQCFSDLQFKTPVLYSKLQNLNPKILDPTLDICQYEDDLKLILKIPANNTSSIVILEGDYTTYNDCVIKSNDGEPFLRETNKTVINYENLKACDVLADKLITPLQLLRTNTGESYPFADRLVEYLTGNAITINETIADNINRAKTVISMNCPAEIAVIDATDGIWEPILQCLTYDYINKKRNVHDINHDILGFIDKDVEKWYAAVTDFKRNQAGQLIKDPITNQPIPASIVTIANVDIYKE